VDDRIVLLQRVHSYSIDQQSDRLTVTGELREQKAAAKPHSEGSLDVSVAAVEPGDDAA